MAKHHSPPWKPEQRQTKKREKENGVHAINKCFPKEKKNLFTQAAKPEGREGRLGKCSSNLFLSAISFERKITSCRHAQNSTYWWKGELSVIRKGRVSHLGWHPLAFVRSGSREVCELAFKASRCETLMLINGKEACCEALLSPDPPSLPPSSSTFIGDTRWMRTSWENSRRIQQEWHRKRVTEKCSSSSKK